MSDYTQAIDLDPDLAIAYYRRGFIHYLVKNYARAIGDYDRAIELNPADARSYSSRGFVYRTLACEPEALLDLQQAAKLFQEQGNLTKYHNTLELIDRVSSDESWESGMF